MRFIFSAVFLVFSNIATSQNDIASFMDINYDGGHEAFLKSIYSSLKYPHDARTNCINGKTTFEIHISAEGNVDSILHFNKLGFGIEEAIRKSVILSNGKFIPGDIRIVRIDIQFLLNQHQEKPADITVFGYSTRNGIPTTDCKTNEELLEQFTRYLKKEKYKKADKIVDQLLFRRPHEEHYKGLKKFVEGKLKE